MIYPLSTIIYYFISSPPPSYLRDDICTFSDVLEQVGFPPKPILIVFIFRLFEKGNLGSYITHDNSIIKN